MSHEDVRRSLEVLDSVLAEFDDCLESWDNFGQDTDPPGDESLRIHKEKKSAIVPSDGKISQTSFSYDSQRIDGDTSHDSGLSLQEQVKVASPPPVPKRSATTKLSDRNSGLFTFSQSDSHLPDSTVQDNDASLSTKDVINTLSSKDDDEVFGFNENNAKSHCCTKCGREIDAKELVVEKIETKDKSSSPFSEKRKMFEEKLNDSRNSISPFLERSFTGSSFKKTDRIKGSESEPSSLIFYKSTENEGSDSSDLKFTSKYSPKATKISPPRIDALIPFPTSLHHAPNCNCRERIRQLQIKFAETCRLLKANKIKGLDSKPPSFVPPPPPPEVVAKNARNEIQNLDDQNLFSGLPINSTISNSNSFTAYNGSSYPDSLSSEENSGNFQTTSSSISENSTVSITNLEQKLCNRCSKVDLLPLSETIEDLPKLLPTDALNRPHLGLSYYMEDDLCPGVKEILQSSTPKSLPLSKSHKTTSLSTFSLSDSSLGYVSSQSDLELSSSPMKTDKVPVSTIKFSTLPEGMNLHSLPSYYGHEESPKSGHKSNQPLYRDRNFNHTTDPQLRSSSAPPLPETEKPKKKHFRGFSRKEKKKNEDSISVTSYLSLDDGVILKAIDGATVDTHAADSNKTGVEKRRWNALRSILGKK